MRTSEGPGTAVPGPSLAVATYGVNSAGLHWNQLAATTGQNYPDAISGGVLAGKMNSVMLLTPSTSLNSGVAATLPANKAVIDEVYLLGDQNALSAGVRTAIIDALK